MGQGMCVSSRLPPGEDVESSPEEYKPPPKQAHSEASSTKKKIKLKQLPVKVRVFLKSPNKASHGENRPPRSDGHGAKRTEAPRARPRSSRPTAADVIPGVVQRLQIAHQRSFEKDDETCENGIPRDNPKSRQSESSNENENGGRPRTRSFSLRTEKKRVVSTSSEPEDASSSAASAPPPPKPSGSSAKSKPSGSSDKSKALSPRVTRSTRTITKDPKVGLNIIKETTILQDGDEEDAPLAQLDELKQFYSFEGVLEIKYTKVTRTRTGDKSPVVPYKYTRTTVTTSRNTSPSVTPRTLSPSATPSNISPQPSRPVTPTMTSGTQTMIDEEPCFPTSHSTPSRLSVPRNFYYSELDSDSDTVMDTDTGDSSTLSTSDDASLEYVRLISPDDADDESDEDEDEEVKASYLSVANTSFDSFGMSPQYDSARSMSESSSLTSVTMLPSPVSWSVPLREADIAEDMLSPIDIDEVDTLCTNAPVSHVSEDNLHDAMQDLRVDSDNDSGVDHGGGRSDESLVVEEPVSRNTLGDLFCEAPSDQGATSDNTKASEQKVNKDPPPPPPSRGQQSEVPKQSTRPKESKKTPQVSLRQHIPPFTSNRIPYATAASSWPFRIRPASMMFQFNRRYIGRTGQGNALMMLFGPLIYNPNFPWHDALVTLKVPRHVIKDMNAHLAICSAHQKKKKAGGIRVLDTRKDPTKEIDGDDYDDEGSDVDAGRNLEAVLVVEVQEPQPEAAAAASSSSSAGHERQKGKKSKSKDASQEHCFTKVPPKKDDAECIIL